MVGIQWSSVYSINANTNDGSSTVVVDGCTNSAADNYDSSANTDDGSCIHLSLAVQMMDCNELVQLILANQHVIMIHGCKTIRIIQINYDSNANVNDGSCIPMS